MNGIEKITARIEADAQAEIDQILAAARVEAEEITARYRLMADAEAAALTAKNERSAMEQEERLVSAAQMEARKTVLAAKQNVVNQVYDLALKKLCAMTEEQYKEVLVKLLMEAVRDGREEVIFSSKDRDTVGKSAVEIVNAAGNSLVLSEETRVMEGGFILRSKSMETNCTFETLVRLQRAETAGAVVKMLFV